MSLESQNRHPDWVRGLRIVITGAAGVLGNGLVEEASRQGALVVATGREPRISDTAFPAGVRVIPADVADASACRLLIEQAADSLGGIDVLINNAAVLTSCRIIDLDEAELERSWAVNLRAPVLLTQAAIPFLEASPAPVVVNIVSSAGFTGGVAPVSAYAMTKAALIVFTKSAAREFGRRGIRVVAVSPPTMESQMQAALDDESRRTVRGANVLGRLFDVVEAARLVLFLASPYGSTVTGTTVDGTGAILS